MREDVRAIIENSLSWKMANDPHYIDLEMAKKIAKQEGDVATVAELEKMIKAYKETL
jgi:hypothetical protein